MASQQSPRNVLFFLDRIDGYVIAAMHIYVHLNNSFTFILQSWDSLSAQNQMKFTTKDNDNDTWGKNCAAHYGNGWWFSACLASNLNGVYYKKPQKTNNGITWVHWQNSSIWETLQSSKMMIR